MTAIIVLIICSLIVAGGFLFAFLFSVKSGQYDDTYTPSVRMLFDESGRNTNNDLTPENSEAEETPTDSLNTKS